MDKLPTKRKLAAAAILIIFTISMVSLFTSLIPTNFNSGEMTQTNPPLDGPSTDSTSIEDDVPEPEDLVEVHTKPTLASDWKPKVLPDPSLEIVNAVERNLYREKTDKILLTAVANNGMETYTRNWIESLKQCGLDDKFLVFAIDTELVDTLTAYGYEDHVVLIPQDWFHQKISSGFAKWLDKTYMPITHAKSLVVERLLYMDVTVWFSDVDIVIRSPNIYAYLLAKMQTRKSMTEVLFSQETEQDNINSGFYVMRPTSTSKRILADSILISDKEPKVTQQRAINKVLSQMNLSYKTSAVALLDTALFPQGKMFFENNIPRKYGFEPMIVHANYRVGDKKRISLQKAGLWFID